jgi:hypothetical protein
MKLQTLSKKISRKWREAQSEAKFRWHQLQFQSQRPELDALDQRIVKNLRQEGVAVTTLEDLAIPGTDQFLQAARALKADLEQQPTVPARPQDRQHAFSHAVPASPVQIAKDYPELFVWGLSDRVLNILEAYVGAPVACQGVNLRRDVIDGQQIGTRFWHVDGEDRHVIKIILYLTDVGAENGPFEYIPKAKSPAYRRFKAINYQISDQAMAQVVPPSDWQACLGKAGTVIFTDTAKVFHHGRVPQSERVAVFWAYTSQHPRRPELCNASSFQQGLPYLQTPLSERQRDRIWNFPASRSDKPDSKI